MKKGDATKSVTNVMKEYLKHEHSTESMSDDELDNHILEFVRKSPEISKKDKEIYEQCHMFKTVLKAFIKVDK